MERPTSFGLNRKRVKSDSIGEKAPTVGQVSTLEEALTEGRKTLSAPQNIIAVVFDFDDTLTDESTSALLQSAGIDTADFWQKKVQALIDDGWAPVPAYLKLMLDNVGPGKRLKKLTNAKLRAFGAGLRFYKGLPGLFTDLQRLVQEHPLSNPGIEFYVVSSGLREIIKGSRIAQYMTGIWGCEFAENGDQIRHIKNVVSFTEKTKYLYTINKGISDDAGPYSVNEKVEQNDRRIPFTNMIYIGDGLTDVPCFSLIDHFGGRAFGVFDPKKAEAPKKAWETLVAPKRVTSMNAPRYGAKDELGSLLRVAVTRLCFEMDERTLAVRI